MMNQNAVVTAKGAECSISRDRHAEHDPRSGIDANRHPHADGSFEFSPQSDAFDSNTGQDKCEEK